MDVSNILNELNDRQRDAVTSEAPSLLVLAGAGSGKTRVLVHRVAWIVEAMQSNPNSVMAVTFTNKAANEMTGRIEQILDQPIPEMWCGTFHSISNRLLTTPLVILPGGAVNHETIVNRQQSNDIL